MHSRTPAEQDRVQGKLVRDLIPEIIRQSGRQPLIYTADVDEYGRRLRLKLQEEVDEFLEADSSTSTEELADILEVVYALAHELGMSPQQLETVRLYKAAERGGFKKRIVWTGNA
ncbi:nucleoside triphosphate pyrophosphohydrolase [Streptomyces sp. WMMC905]|uniref:nucleoside triphosphate pyrophosphohydrolase n=1 Tax=Streptomyces sp. WMMC905 TaxID=3404123 RepID=UPI003B95C1E5